MKNINHSASDHNLVEVNVKLSGNIGTAKEVRKRVMSNWNEEVYKSRIRYLNWTDLYNSTSVSASYGIFEQKIRSILDDMAPMRNIQIRNNYKSWVSQEAKTMMESRNTLRIQASRSQLPADWKKYKDIKNKCTMKL